MSTEESTGERASLRALAAFFGRLLVRELDAADLASLREESGELLGALEDLGISLPSPAEEAAWLEARGADYHELFLRPESGPLVQSLWTQGRYEGDATVRVRELATFAGFDYQREAARGAAVDHLGSLLLLWSATEGRVQEVADELAREHFAWAERPLTRIAEAEGFYGAVGGACRTLLRELCL